MTISEKTRLLPTEYQKSYVIPIHQEDVNNNTNLSFLSEFDSNALTKDEVDKYVDDPYWVRVRNICFSIYWLLCLVALVISCYIAFSALETGYCNKAINGDSASLTENATVAGLHSSTTVVPSTTISAADKSGIVFHILSES